MDCTSSAGQAAGEVYYIGGQALGEPTMVYYKGQIHLVSELTADIMKSDAPPTQNAPDPVGIPYHTSCAVTTDAPRTQEYYVDLVGIPDHTSCTVTTDAPPTQECADPVGIPYHTSSTVTSDAPPTQKCADPVRIPHRTRSRDRLGGSARCPRRPRRCRTPTRKPVEVPTQKADTPGSNTMAMFGAGCLIAGLAATWLYKLRK